MVYSIEKLVETDWQLFAATRLKALQADPLSFGSNYDRELKFTEHDWCSRLSDPNSGIFIVLDGSTVVGLTAVSVDREDASGRTALFWGSWLNPNVRRKGISRLLYRTRLDWVTERPAIQRIVVSHRESNVASRFAIQKFGFVPTHVAEKTWNDGSVENECFYELVLAALG